MIMWTSSFLREHCHGNDMTYITNTAIEVINFVKFKGLESPFSSEGFTTQTNPTLSPSPQAVTSTAICCFVIKD